MPPASHYGNAHLVIFHTKDSYLNSTRRYPRISCNLPASIVFLEDNVLPFNTTATQLGQGGCLLLTSELIATDIKFLLELELPKTTVRLVARVLYEYAFKDGTYVGVEFEDADDAPKALVEYIEGMMG